MYVWGLLVAALLRVCGFGGFASGYGVCLSVGFACVSLWLLGGWFSCYFDYIAQLAAFI